MGGIAQKKKTRTVANMTGAQHKILPTPMATASFCATARLAPPVLSTNKSYYKNSSTWLLLWCTSARQLVASGQKDGRPESLSRPINGAESLSRKLRTGTRLRRLTVQTQFQLLASDEKTFICVHRFLGSRAKHAHVFQKTRESTPRHASVRAGCDRLGGA